MIKRLYSWHIKQRRFKLAKSGLFNHGTRDGFWTQVKGLGVFKVFRRKQYYFASEGRYVYEKAGRRRFFRYLFLGAILFITFGWFIVESYRGWGMFGL